MTKYLILAIMFLNIAICNKDNTANLNHIDSIIAKIKYKYAPDSRLAVFNVGYKIDSHQTANAKIILKGETDNVIAKDELLKSLLDVKINFVDSVKILPDKNLGDNIYGLVSAVVCNITKLPNSKSELINQAVMGMELSILKKQKKYYYIQTNDKYLGWVDSADIFILNKNQLEEWRNSTKVIIVKHAAKIFSKPNIKSKIFKNIVLECLMRCTSKNKNWVVVNLLDETTGYIKKSDCMDYEQWKLSRNISQDNIRTTAKSFIGVKYLWGGTSVRGMDCSGFTKITYRQNGVELYRDANQQINNGKEVHFKNYNDLKCGDLIFFGKTLDKVYHVGIYLDSGKFIHSSKNVHISSLDSNSKIFNKQLKTDLVSARRIIN